MKINILHQIIYSPTGTSRGIVNGIAEGVAAKQTDLIDLTIKPSDKVVTVTDGLAVIGVPVYAGRVAPEAVKRLASVKGKGIPAVLVVVYGNREFEDALIELRDLAVKAGFKPVAGAAFVGEHSYSSDDKPIAAGRPDVADISKARELGITVKQHLKKGVPDMVLQVPGDIPYKDYMGPSGISPDVITDRCGLCKDCIDVCPVGAISEGDTAVVIDKSLCSMCCACVKVCNKNALMITAERVLERVELLFQNCQERKEPELFFLTKRPFEGIVL